MIVDNLISILLISLFCVGWRTVIDDGQLLSFLRKPFVYLQNEKIVLEEKYISLQSIPGAGRECQLVSSRLFKIHIYIYLLKPIVGCVTCFSSFWGVIIYIAMHPEYYMPNIFICCIACSYLNTLLWSAYEKYF